MTQTELEAALSVNESEDGHLFHPGPFGSCRLFVSPPNDGFSVKVNLIGLQRSFCGKLFEIRTI